MAHSLLITTNTDYNLSLGNAWQSGMFQLMHYPYYCAYLVIIPTPGQLILLFRDMCACLSVTLTMFNYLNMVMSYIYFY